MNRFACTTLLILLAGLAFSGSTPPALATSSEKPALEATEILKRAEEVLNSPSDLSATSTMTVIDTDGTARMCYYSWEETVGNVWSDGGIRRVWNNAIYRKTRETIESECPFYRYCVHCSHRLGFSRIEAHVGKNAENAHLFAFDWDRAGAPPRPGSTRPGNPRAEPGPREREGGGGDAGG